VRVPCSTSNLGAGFDCIGVALQRWLDARFLPDDEPLRIERHGTLAALTGRHEDLTLRAFRTGLAARGIRRATGRIHATSDIPIARGLGSSAAATVAGLVLATAAAGDALDRTRELERALALEGHPDNAAPALHGGLVAVTRAADGMAHATRLPLAPTLGFAFAAPDVEVATARARAALPQNVPHAVASRALGRVAALVHGLATGDPALLALGFEDELHVPYRLPLIPDAARALDAARTAGAFAATISGSGSGIIAVTPADIAAAVAEAMGDAFGGGVAFALGADDQGVVAPND
jgi:homoserine kinase